MSLGVAFEETFTVQGEGPMPTYSYAECLQTAYRINWRISDVIGTHRFDRSRRWLPSGLSGVDQISCLTAEEKTKPLPRIFRHGAGRRSGGQSTESGGLFRQARGAIEELKKELTG